MPVTRPSQILHITKLRSSVRTIRYLLTLRISSRKSTSSNLLPYLILTKPYSMSTANIQPITRPFYTAWMSTSTLLSLTSQVQQISVAPVIIPKHGMRPMERALTTTAKAVSVIITKMTTIERVPTTTAETVPVTTIKIMTIKRILIILKHKKSGKDGCYRLYQQQDP